MALSGKLGIRMFDCVLNNQFRIYVKFGGSDPVLLWSDQGIFTLIKEDNVKYNLQAGCGIYGTGKDVWLHCNCVYCFSFCELRH